MKNILLIISVSILGIFAFSCTDSGTKNALAVSEEIIMDKPDSALSLLEGIDPNKLRGPKDKALYGLLYTMALDKNHLEIRNDSLIDYSVDYFKKKSDKQRLAIALYYQGRVKYMNGNHPLALVTYMQAIDAAEEIDDRFYIGMSCRGISDIYSDSYNAGDELIYAKREYENIKASGRQPYINYAMLDLATSYHNYQSYQEVYKIVQQLKDSAITANDLCLYENSLRLLASSYLADNKPNMAVTIYELLCKENISCTEDSSHLAVAYAFSGNNEKAAYILNHTNFTDSILKEAAYTHVRQTQKQYAEALFHAQVLDSLANDILHKKVSENLSTSVFNNYQAITKKDRDNIQNSKFILYLFIISILVLITIIIWMTTYKVHKQRKKIIKTIFFAEQLKELLQQSKKANDSASITIKNLLSSKYELLEELCGIIITNSDKKSARKKIADTVTTLINELSIESRKIEELGIHVDQMYNNIYTDFKNSLPRLNDVDYRLYLFSVLGFSNTTISLFLKEEKINAVYDRRRRLKDKIKKLDNDKASRFLSFL